MIQKKSDDAVSPVIGVMLMLVMTVIVAAVITIFATGTVADTEPAPTAVLDVKIYDYYQAIPGTGGPDFHITQISGDALDTKNLEIRLSWEHDGKSYFSTYSADSFAEKYPDGITSAMNKRDQPMYVKATGGKGPFGLDNYFGDVFLKPGLTLTASADLLSPGSNDNNLFMDVIFNNGVTDGLDSQKGIMDLLPEGTAVNVMILHIPSNKAIFDKEVFVQ